MADLLPSAQVTIADLYRELIGMRQDIGKALVRIEVIDSRNTDADKVHADHESRIRQLEKFRWQLAGALILIGGLAAWAGYLLGHK